MTLSSIVIQTMCLSLMNSTYVMTRSIQCCCVPTESIRKADILLCNMVWYLETTMPGHFRHFLFAVLLTLFMKTKNAVQSRCILKMNV